MLDHVSLQVADIDTATSFYTSVFAPLGVTESMRFPTPFGTVVGLADRAGKLFLWFGPVSTGGTAREVHIAISAGSRDDVDAVHQAAVAAGVEILHAAREWPEYHPGYYAVFLRDPDGNNSEAVFHG